MMLVKDGEIYTATDETILDTIRANDIHTEMADALQNAVSRSHKNFIERPRESARPTSRARNGLTTKYKECDLIPKERISARLYLSVLQEKRRRIGTLIPVQSTDTGKGPLGAVTYAEAGSGNTLGPGEDGAASGGANAMMGLGRAVPDDNQAEEGEGG